MLIKSMSRKTASFAQLYDYITRHQQNCPPTITHNMPEAAQDRAGVLKRFFANARAIKPRKNGVWLFHEVLSFHADDATALSAGTMQKLTEYYLQLRAPKGLAIAEVHFDTKNPHVHIMLSANELCSSKRVRVSKMDFARIKQKTEIFQREVFPNSICQNSTGKERRRSDQNQEARFAASTAANDEEYQHNIRRSSFFRSKRSKKIPPFTSLRRFVGTKLDILGSKTRKIAHAPWRWLRNSR